jgi:CRP-like cAMP-binding protein
VDTITSTGDEEWGSVYDVAPRRPNDILTILSQTQLFEPLARRELSRIAAILHHRDYMPRETIVKQGAPGVGMYIIQSGGADVLLEDASGATMLLATLTEGRFFGEMSLLDGAPRAATVKANTRTHVLGFFKADLMDLIEESPRLGLKIVLQLTQLMHARLVDTMTEYRTLEREVRRIRRSQGA